MTLSQFGKAAREQMLLKPDYLVEPCKTFGEYIDSPEGVADYYGTNMALEVERKEAVIVELQRLLDVKDAEIDRLTQPTKPWLVVGWVIMAGCAMGVIGGIYKVIT